MNPDQGRSFENGLKSLLPRLRRFAHALSANRADAEDLTQSTVERALRSRSKWKPGSRLDRWIYKIMRNLWIDTVRSRSRRERFEATQQEASALAEDSACPIEDAVDLKTVLAAMRRLPDEQREVVALILVEGFRYREAADMLDLPIGTVSSRLVRGRTALLSMLGADA